MHLRQLLPLRRLIAGYLEILERRIVRRSISITRRRLSLRQQLTSFPFRSPAYFTALPVHSGLNATAPADSCARRGHAPGSASFPARGEAYCGSRDRSMSQPPISTARRREKALHDRRTTRMDVLGAGRAFGLCDVAAGVQALTIWPTIKGWRRRREPNECRRPTRSARIYSLTSQDDGRRAT